MWQILVFFGILFAGGVASQEHELPRSNKEIVVAFSKRPPFVFYDENGALRGLDVSIIENFAKKFNFRIKYNEFNESLNEVFSREETIENILVSVNLRYDF